MSKTVKTVTERLQEMHKNLIEKRIILIDGVLTENIGLQIEEMLDILSANDGKIDLYINSSGGNVRSFLSICDKIDKIKNNVSTICLEEASGGAAILLCAGTKGLRFALGHSKISLQQNLWVKDSGDTDLEKAGMAIVSAKDLIISYLQKYTGLNKDLLEKIISSGQAFSVKESIDFNIIDSAIGQ